MKKNVIKLLTASLVIFLLGIVICSVAFIYAKATDVNLFDWTEFSASPSYELNFDNVEKKGSLPLNAIDIRAEKADVTVYATDGKSRVFFENPDSEKTTCTVENGILKIYDSVPFFIMGLSVEDGKTSFAGFRNVFSQGLYSHGDKSVTIYLNENDIIGDIKISLGIGNVTISDINFENLTLSSSYGNATIENSHIAEKADINLKKGNISIENCSYVFVNAASTVGTITAQVGGRKTNCETTLGNINVKTDKAISDYNLRASLSNGKIFSDGTVCDGKEYNIANVDGESIWLKSVSGDISIYNSVTNE